nr:immunoglobulin light chain junction region [Macaca mulatta]MOX98648.1 immunoglobulin light chain junction region [Macaca mulatta]MOX99164.1 immunoglobulin light chain junction region [Macaca mulatta]MOY01462.1 immunoglobulin light chain junction region [Macaca mulatta]MOY02125.1 immunoglobulin light chain junction region [Macaca mulatta]
CLQDVQLPFTF